VNAPIQNILAVAGRVRAQSGCFHMLDLLSGLAGRGCGVSLACASIASEISSRGAPFPATTWSALGGRWTGFVGAAALRDFYARAKAQVIHVHGAGLRYAGRRFLNAVRAPAVYTPYSLADDLRGTLWIRRRAARVIALSEYMREGLVNRCRVPRENLRVVPPGIELSRYECLPPRIGERIAVVGCVAPLEPDRGQSIFLRAARLLTDSGREAEFVVAGDGPAEHALRREAAELGIQKRVTFATQLSEYRGVISTLDVFVRPALEGGLGYAVLEAMAMGKAVVATSTGSVPEMVVEGKGGVMVAKGDTAALAEAVGRLLDAPQAARELGAAARRSVAERFSMDRLVQSTLKVYAEAVEEASE